jgi:hypothetical protein
MGLEQTAIQAVADELPPLLSEKNCFKNSADKSYNGQLLILKPSALAPWAKEPENQLWTATGGFGTNADSRGRAVYDTMYSFVVGAICNRPRTDNKCVRCQGAGG